MVKKIALTLLTIASLDLRAQTQPSDTAKVNPRVKEIIVVFKTHFDIGYTRRVKDIVQYYRTGMIDKALDIMDNTRSLPKDEQFAWTAPGWVMAKVLQEWPGQTPERHERLEEAFKTGRFVAHAMPFSVESQLWSPEDAARSFESSSFVSRKYRLPLPRGAKMTDVPSQAGVLATGLARGGVKFMHIGCNWPSGYVQYPPVYWWEGPDGSRVLTVYSVIYGTTVGLTYPREWVGKDEFGKLGSNLIPPADWPYSVWPAIFVTPDNSGPPSAEDVAKLFEEAKRRMPGVKIKVGRLEDFADAILATNPKIPTVKGEAPDTWIHGCMSDPGGMKLFRNVDPYIPVVEELNSQLKGWKLDTGDISRAISKAYENVLLYSEHTWGGSGRVDKYGDDFKKLPPESFHDLEQSWEDKTDYIRTADSIIRPLLANNLQRLADSTGMPGDRIVIYNPLPYERSGWVETPDRRKYVFAQNVPPSGYKTYIARDLTAESYIELNTRTIQNKYFKITFDPASGNISSLIDRRTGKEWVDRNASVGLGQYMNERFTFEQTLKYVTDYQQGRAMDIYGARGVWPHFGMHKPGMISEKVVPYRRAMSKSGALKIVREGYKQIAIVDMPGDSANHFPASSLRVTLQDNEPFVDMEITIEGKAKDNWPEADWFCFPFNIRSPKFKVGCALGMMDPATDILEGADKDLYATGTGVTITGEDGSGIGFFPFDHPLISLGRPGIWKFSKDYVPEKPIVYLNLYNNQWNTNYRYWYPGTWSSKVRIWTFVKGSTVESGMITPSFSARTPLLAAEAKGAAGSLPTAGSGIAVSRKGIQVTAFHRNSVDNPVYDSVTSDENATLLRVWEQAGVSGNVVVTLPDGSDYTRATPVNLRGEVLGKPFDIKGRKLEFYLGAYAPESFVLDESRR